MSNTDDMPTRRPNEIVRLKIDGTKSTVNTFREQQTVKGVSLLCPFPALEVDIPACFGSNEEMVFGAIHRIGVEDDPETGLPRLRLQIRTHDNRETTIHRASDMILKEAAITAPAPETAMAIPEEIETMPEKVAESREELVESPEPEEAVESPDEVPASPVDAMTHDEVVVAHSRETDVSAAKVEEAVPTASGERDDAADEPPVAVKPGFDSDGFYNTTDIFYDSAPGNTGNIEVDNSEPGWVGCHEFPAPEELLWRMKTRRRYRAVKYAVAAFVVGMVAATGYTLHRAGIVNFEGVKDRFARATMTDGSEREEPAVAKTDPLSDEGTVSQKPKSDMEKAVAATAAPAPDNAGVTPPADSGEQGVVTTVPSSVVEATVAAAARAEDASYAPPPAEAIAETKGDESGEPLEEIERTDVTVTLPTRWPVEYTTAYRVRDPNGVVVDVPGGLVRREGWLDIAEKSPLIRSVKAVQRENGARFIVFVNGELPRFMTSPKSGGVSLRLFYDDNAENSSTVASLNNN